MQTETKTNVQCALGFTIDNLDSKCKLVWNIAGRSSGTENLTVICPKNYIFDVDSSSCVVGTSVTAVISAPLVCIYGWRLDPNGKCRKIE